MNRISIAGRPRMNRCFGWLLMVALVAANVLVGTATVWGGQLKVTPHIGARTEYDTNITYTANNEVDDYTFILNPGVQLVYDSIRTSFDFSADMDILRYLNESQLDDEHYRISLSARYLATERLYVSLSGSYVADTTLDSQLEETGYITGRSNREVLRGGGGITYRLSEISSMGFGYNRSRTNYESPDAVDSDGESLSVSYSRLLNDGRDTLNISPYYSNNSSTASDVNTYGFSVGLSHIYSERMSLSFSLGARYTETERDLQRIVFVTTPAPHFEIQSFKDKTNSWGAVGDASLTYEGDIWSVNLGYNRGLTYTSQGDAVNTDRLSGGVSYRLTERLSSRVRGSFYRNMSDQEGQVDSRRYEISPGVSYSLTENANLDFSYSFSYAENDRQNGDGDIMRHRVVLSLRYNFPLEY